VIAALPITALIVGVEPPLLAVCLLIVFVGALVQGTVGVGLGMLGAPLLALVDPAFVPVGILFSVVPLSLTMAWRERHHVDRSGIQWAVVGRVPGTVAGAWVVGHANGSVLAYTIGAVVLLGVVASLAGVRFAPTRRNLAIAGVASGFTGTSAGIGGPPIVLTYQHGDPATIRSTLAVYFTIGLVISFVSLWIGGVIDRRQIQLGLLLIPASIVGTVVAPWFARRVPAGRVRVGVLLLCAMSALLLLAEELL